MYPKKRKRTKKAISLMTAFAMLSSVMGTTVAAASVHLDSQPVMSEGSRLSMANSQPDVAEKCKLGMADSQLVAVASGTVTTPTAIDATKPDNGSDEGEKETGQIPGNSIASEKAGELSYQEVYSKMAALKEKYPEGMIWTNFEPYGSKSSISEYRWKGGKILGNVSSGVGCAAFAFILSDAAFGELPAREVYNVKFDEVKPGDILRINNNSHSVIVLQKTAAGVIVAEGNYNKSVHWGRALSKTEVENANFLVTRYPENYDSSGSDAVEAEIGEGFDGSLKWTLTDRGTLTISGSGAMRNFSLSDRPDWDKVKDQINTVVIENGVTSIGAYAFCRSVEEGSNILSVSIPGSVVTIGNNAFTNCVKLLSATIPEGVETIGEMAFSGCIALQYIDFPASITAIGEAAFRDCKEIVSVRFIPGSSRVSIGDSIFERCWNLTKVTLPEKAERISGGMFAGCNLLSELYIPAGITEIKTVSQSGSGPFCQNLKVLNFAGSEARWIELQGPVALTRSGCQNLKPNFEVLFPNPFAQDPNDPGDNMGGHVHSWASAEWNHDNSYHWHECSAEGCPVTDSMEKDGYAEHSYGSWVTDVNATSSQSGSRHRDCTVCAYRQTESIPASGSTGGSWGSGSTWGSGNYGGSGSTSGSGNSGKPEVPDTPDSSDGKDGSSGNTGSNTSGGSSSDADGSGDTDIGNSDASNSSDNNQKEQKTQFKKQLRIRLKQQIKIQLKKQQKTGLKWKSKSQLKKQLKAELKPQLKARLKKQMKKQYGEVFGKEFIDLFNLQFNAQFKKLFSEQFHKQYKLLTSQKIKNK